jgi:hypothetical protein
VQRLERGAGDKAGSKVMQVPLAEGAGASRPFLVDRSQSGMKLVQRSSAAPRGRYRRRTLHPMTAPRIPLPIGLLAAGLCLLVTGARAAPPDAPPAHPDHVATQPRSAEAETASLERLRERLAEKLGATHPPGSTDPNVLRVVNRPAAPASTAR